MEKKTKLYNRGVLILVCAGLLITYSAICNFPVEKISAGLIALSVVTVFFSTFVRIRMPRTDVFLTISDALIFLAFLIYGKEIAVLLALLESIFTSFAIRRNGGKGMRLSTFGFNVGGSVMMIFTTASVVELFFSSTLAVETASLSHFVLMLTVMAFAQFSINSILVSFFMTFRNEKSFWRNWNDICLNALIIFVADAGFAGISVISLRRIDMILFAVVVGFVSLLLITYRRYANDINETAAVAEQSERERREQAEQHIVELQQHIGEQDRISDALRESKERFRHAAFHDKLTNLPNRNLFIEKLKTLLEKSKQLSGCNFAVLYLDLNRFKTINESLGHSTGDKLILHVAKRLSNFIREGDLAARFGGDEFAVILNNVNELQSAIDFAGRINEKLSEPFIVSGRKVFTSVSIGIALCNPGYGEAEEILRDSDIAMYDAKDHNKPYAIFNPQMHNRAVKLLEIETDLRCAIERNELRAFFQPIVDLNQMTLYGFEALIRWQHPQRGLIPPVEFIPVSEETGLIVPITLWMLRTCCEKLVKWQKKSQLNKSLVLSVNLSGKHFAEENLVQQIGQILFDTSLDPGCLKLEITESAVMENPENVISMLVQLKLLGVHLSIDDFGTGYSSLSYLHRFPIDTLKVDRSFVSAMDEGSENGEIVRTIVSLAKTLGMNVIAEGIETIHQLHQLRILGCEYGQGYLFSRPLPLEETEKLLENRDRFKSIMPAVDNIFPAQTQTSPYLRLAK